MIALTVLSSLFLIPRLPAPPGQVLDGEIPEHQRVQTLECAKLSDLSDVTILADEGLSGYKTSRPGFQQLLAAWKSREVSMVVVYDLSWLTRRVRDMGDFVEDVVERFQIKLVSIRESIDTSTPSGKAFINIAAVFAQMYRNEIAYKTKAAILHKQKHHEYTGGTVAFGNVGEDLSQPMPADLNEDSVIDYMIELHQRGHGYRAIASELNRRGIPTKTKTGHWHPKVVMQTLYRARRISRGRICQGIHDEQHTYGNHPVDVVSGGNQK
jgi:DNA invertase Pin-like site-specific DNA recombinase